MYRTKNLSTITNELRNRLIPIARTTDYAGLDQLLRKMRNTFWNLGLFITYEEVEKYWIEQNFPIEFLGEVESIWEAATDLTS